MMGKLRFAWWMFWARRSRWRIALMCMLLALTVLAIVWLALPVDWRRQAQNGATSAAQWVGSLDTRTLLVALIGLCVVEALVLLFVPSYRKHGYLTTAPTLIPRVSVYLDAENQLSEVTIRSFMAFLTKYLDGRRADLLYFLDASGGYKEKRELLNHVGFRLVDAPHNPSGKKDMREAVDREIAMHAFERGILGPDRQEFIIVSGDGDYVPLIYRLVALGHRVQILALSPSSAYDVVEDYLGVTVTNLATVLDIDGVDLTEGPTVQLSPGSPQGKRPKKKTKKKASRYPTFVPQGHHVIPTSGEGKIYYAIAETLDAYYWSMQSAKSDSERNAILHKTVWNVLRPRLSSVGYGVGRGADYWIEHLIALDLFSEKPGHNFPERGDATIEGTAHVLLLTAQATIQPVLAASSQNGIVHMKAVANAFGSGRVGEDGIATPLLHLVRVTTGTKQWAHIRYFAHLARALGLLMFDDVPGNLDEISHPRLPNSIADPDEPRDDAHAADKDDDAPPTSEEPPNIE